ncbi:hypothetical protein ACHMWN_06895 [Pedobacter sp. UC225_61]|uniref:hypothetical protein n=1 Tax=Pedobacter sp. UC225_61 TaxID=3374623 RepID=UPI0037B37C34
MKTKNIFLTAFVVILLTVKGFSQKSLIYGTTASDWAYKYVYFYDPQTKVLLSSPIIDHKFNIEIDKPNGFKILMLNFNTYLLSTYKELLESPEYGYVNGSRIIALEDTVQISLIDKTQNAIVKGKSLNKDIDDMYVTIKTRKYTNFFEQHSNSPVSLIFLKTLVQNVIDGSSFFNYIECKLWFNKLSEKVKSSNEGKEISKMLGD